MATKREKRGKQVDELNYIPLLVEHLGPLQAMKVLGFLALWGASGEPKLTEIAYRNVYGLSKSAVYGYMVQLRSWAAWCRDVKGYTNISDNIDEQLALARRALAQAAQAQAQASGLSEVLDNAPAALVG